MSITSSPFGGTRLTGDDAKAFERQIAQEPSEPFAPSADVKKMVAEYLATGRVTMTIKVKESGK